MAGRRPRVGVLALQGDVREHAAVLERVGAEVVLVRRAEQLPALDGLVLPGGESTVIDKLARTFALRDPIRTAIAGGLPVFGTCAGLILLADRLVDAAPGQETFGGLDVTVERNAFGPQIESCETRVRLDRVSEEPMTVALIRGPVIVEVGPAARVLGSLDDGRIVAVEQGPLLGTSFHPEITGEDRVHSFFVAKVRAYAAVRRTAHADGVS